jgi:LuxR family maltose regulon positive regulatory protein
MSVSPAISPAAPARRAVLRSVPREPGLGLGLVARGRLVRRLLDARELPLIVLAAPAGYGKTTTLLDWAQHDERPFAWVTLDRDDDAPDQLTASLPRAVEPQRRRGGAFVLVLEGLHELRSSAACEVVADLVAHPPAGCQVVLSSRTSPPLPLGRLRAHRELLELGARDFAMTHREAAALLERAGLTLDAADVDALVRRTEGWPTGLYLAALSLRDQPDPTAAVAEFGGDDRLVADYLEDAQLSDLSADDVTFLLRTSILDRLSGPLCDAVAGTEGGAARLVALARANVMLVPLDRTDRWFRYHGMLAEMLHAELARREPALEPELHRRASRWHAEHGDVDQAVRHAAAASDVALAGDLLWANAPRYLAVGRQEPVRRCLARFTPEQAAASAPLALVAAGSHLVRGERDLAEYWAAAAARALEGVRDADPLKAGVATVRAAVARDGLARMRDDAALANELGAKDSPWRSLDRFLEGAASQLLGEDERAGLVLRDGARLGLIAAPGVNALCLAQLALLALEAGAGQEGSELAVRARAQVERSRLADQPTMGLVLAVSALGRARLGQLQAAAGDSADAVRLLERLGDAAPWYRAEAGIVLGRVMLALNDVASARSLLDAAAFAVGSVPDGAVLAAWLAEARERVDARCASAAVEPASLTVAELRIMRLLPTHLSFREMGSQLYVSPNTVKTQAQAVYRKLDASSRSEAVERARELGLLDVQVAV